MRHSKKKFGFDLTAFSGCVIFILVNSKQAREILLNEIRDLKAYDEYMLIKATRVWLATAQARQRSGR